MTCDQRIAVVGAGLVGRRHIDHVQSHARLDAVVDPSEEARELAREIGAAWYPGLGAYLPRSRADGVIIATPNRVHADQALAIIEQGLPVLVEKPITANAHEGARLVSEAEHAGVPLLVGHHRRHNPLIAAAKAAVESGRLGRIALANAQFWLHKPDGYFAESWRRQAGAGPVYINLIHDLDLLRHLCGEIVAVSARESNQARGFEVEDTAVILLEFASGALGTVSLSDSVVAPWSWEFASGENPAYPKTNVPSMMIGGTHGALSIPDLTVWTQPNGRDWWKPIQSETLEHAPADPLICQLQNFLAVIRGDESPLVSGRDGLQSLIAVEAVKRAAETGMRVALRVPDVASAP
ncbi:MAG: Gfo/Idh/MocA family oxidoreductase [Pseudomonadota bacterium]